MTTTAPYSSPSVGSIAGVGSQLDEVARADDAMRGAEIERIAAVVEYAVAHPPIDAADRARGRVPTGGIDGRTESVPLNSSGVPVVSACAVAELGARLRMSTDSARALVAEALELAYRLPGLWERVLTGELVVWKARQVAARTVCLSADAVGFVHRHLQAAPGHYGVALLERLIDTALAEHDPAHLRERTAAEAETRRLDVHLDQYTLGGTAPISGVLELADAIAFDAAVAHGAAELAALGSTASLDVRRARAGGDMAREHLSLFGRAAPGRKILVDDQDRSIEPLPPTEDEIDAAATAAAGAGVTPQQRLRAGRREVLLVAHMDATVLSDTAGTGGDDGASGGGADPGGRGGTGRGGCRGGRSVGGAVVGRVENTRTPVDVEAIRRWIGDENVKVTVQPVIDLNGRIHAKQYEVPVRLRRQVVFRDITCVFPYCGRPATVNAGTRRSVDLDHIDPYDHAHPTAGGQTATENLAPLCRHHHRLKTLRDWDYVMTAPGVMVWTSPAGHRYRRDHTGSWLLTGRPGGASDRGASSSDGTSPLGGTRGSGGSAPPEP